MIEIKFIIVKYRIVALRIKMVLVPDTHTAEC